MKTVILNKDNLEDIKKWVGDSSFVLIMHSAYWTKGGTSPHKKDAEVFKKGFFRSNFCKTLVADGIMKVELK